MTCEAPEKDQILLADGFEDALLGVTYMINRGHAAVYNRSKCIDILVNRDGMSYEEADEFFEFNVAGAYVGPHTPIFLQPMSLEQIHEFAEDL